MRQWRLIYDTPANGAANMAADEAILNAVSEGRCAPTLRLYGWSPPCLSLGYGQRVDEVDLARLASSGWTLVRRPTGGRAILHTDELTYSLALPAHHPLAAGGVIESYRRISAALLAALRILGAVPQADPQAAGAQGGTVCFETPSHYEITAMGKKLVGSAQVRRKDGVLQHGTLPLCGDLARICNALRYETEAAREQAKEQVRARGATLREVLLSPTPSPPTPLPQGEGSPNLFNVWKTAADTLAQGFKTTFGITFEIGSLTDAEREDAATLEQTKYGSDKWTKRR
jgi:lipoate-protein ligase A